MGQEKMPDMQAISANFIAYESPTQYFKTIDFTMDAQLRQNTCMCHKQKINTVVREMCQKISCNIFKK